MPAETIKEFLVSLRYTQDEAALRQIIASVRDLQKEIKKSLGGVEVNLKLGKTNKLLSDAGDLKQKLTDLFSSIEVSVKLSEGTADLRNQLRKVLGKVSVPVGAIAGLDDLKSRLDQLVSSSDQYTVIAEAIDRFNDSVSGMAHDLVHSIDKVNRKITEVVRVLPQQMRPVQNFYYRYNTYVREAGKRTWSFLRTVRYAIADTKYILTETLGTFQEASHAMRTFFNVGVRVGAPLGQVEELKFIGDYVGDLGETMLHIAAQIRQQILSNPGYTGFFGVLGIDPRNKTSIDLLYGLIERYAEVLRAGGNPFVMRAVLQNMGIDPQTIDLMARQMDAIRKARDAFRSDVMGLLGISYEKYNEIIKRGLGYQREMNVATEALRLIWWDLVSNVAPPLEAAIANIFRNLSYSKDITSKWVGYLERAMSYLGNVLSDPLAAFQNLKQSLIDFLAEPEKSIQQMSQSVNELARDVKTVVDRFNEMRDAVGRVAKLFEDHPVLGSMVFGGMAGLEMGGNVGGIVGALGGGAAAIYFSESIRKSIEDYLGKIKGFIFGRPSAPPAPDVSPTAPPDLNVPTSPASGETDSGPIHKSAYRVEVGPSRERPIFSIPVSERLADWLEGLTTYVPWVRVYKADVGASASPTIGDVVKAGAAAAGTTVDVNDPNARQRFATAVAYFMSKGFTMAQAEGIAGRLYAESRLDPNAVNPSSGAYGIAQWLGDRKGLALATGGDFMRQLDLVYRELMTTERSALSALLRSNSPEDAARAMEAFERAGNPAFTEMAAELARKLAEALHGTIGRYMDASDAGFLSRSLRPVPAGEAPLSAIGGVKNINISPTSTFHIHGGGPEIGARILSIQERMHANLVRNLKANII